MTDLKADERGKELEKLMKYMEPDARKSCEIWIASWRAMSDEEWERCCEELGS